MISICIPAYKNHSFISRLLASIAEQTFTDYEVIVTDDSPDDSVENACKPYSALFSLAYYKNQIALGSPANWNFAISKAKGEWIKMMHHDDWFSHKESLKKFNDATLLNSDFIFSAFTEIEGTKERISKMNAAEKSLLRSSPYNLFKKNFIGHPSTTLIRNKQSAWYDENLKWVVDFEFYIRSLCEKPGYTYLEEPLINIGISDSQITKTVFRKISVEIPENIYLINKIGTKKLKNILVYDYYWRLCRNMSIRNVQHLTAHAQGNSIPEALKNIVDFQSRFSPAILRVGAISKILMLALYSTQKFD